MSFDPAHGDTLLVYGGSFDPPHRAHIELPRQVMHHLHADGILYIPAGQPPHKLDRRITPAHHRLAMLQRALADVPHVAISTHELERPGPSYMVDTLEHLHQRWPHVHLRLLIGADMAAIFYKWREPHRILQLADPVVMMRRPLDIPALLQTLPPDLPQPERDAWPQRIVPVDQVDLSSTELRDALNQAAYDSPHLRHAVHPEVLTYIREHNLYRVR